MTSSITSEGLTTQSGPSIQEAWSPPLSLLETFSGDIDLIADLVDTFNADTDARMQKLRAALANSDFSKIHAEAHTIKGGARQVGADAVADACQELETISKLREASLVAKRLDRVQEVFNEVRRAMASYFSNRSRRPW
jgi:two-component system sensor histidine kinase RpfC